MKKILIPTDYSETAHNAAIYAIHFAKQNGIDKLVFLNCFQPIVSTDPFYPLSNSNLVTLQETANENLTKYLRKIRELAPLHFAVEQVFMS